VVVGVLYACLGASFDSEHVPEVQVPNEGRNGSWNNENKANPNRRNASRWLRLWKDWQTGRATNGRRKEHSF